MKTRIIEIVDSKNKSKYVPQNKILFWWCSFKNLYGGCVEFESLDQARNWLNYDSCKQVIIHANEKNVDVSSKID
jgi:hypothetical protein